MVQVVPNSHFWTNVDELVNYIKTYHLTSEEKNDFAKDLLIGLENTKKRGYVLLKDLREKKSSQDQKSLDEWCEMLPPNHRARKELAQIRKKDNLLVKEEE